MNGTNSLRFGWVTSSEASRPRPGQRRWAADRTDAPHGGYAVLPESARSSSFARRHGGAATVSSFLPLPASRWVISR